MLFLFPHINYGVEVYANCTQTAPNKLSKLNNKLLRILLDKNLNTPNVELYRTFNVLPVQLLHEMKLLELVHKFYFHKQLLPEHFKNYFVTNSQIHNHQTRSKYNLHVCTANSSNSQRSCLHRGSKFWNLLPNNLKCYTSTMQFKKNIKNYLLWR